MNRRRNAVQWNIKDALKSIGLFFGFYCIMIAVSFLMIFMSNYDSLASYMQLNSKKISFLFLSILLIFAIVYFYYFCEHRIMLKNTRAVSLLFAVFIVCVFLNFIFGKYVNIYSRPVATFTLLSLMLINRRDTLFLSMIFTVTMFSFDYFILLPEEKELLMYSTLLVSFFAEMTAIYIIDNDTSRFSSMVNGLFIYIPMGIIILLLELNTINNIFSMLGFGLLGAIGSVGFYTVLLPVYETAFNVVTDYRLKELSEPDYKLMKDLKNKAVGTFNHSMILAHLAEACAIELNENPTLARAAAYYHDVGKMKQSEFFSENQSGRNSHDELSPELSADIIRSHAKDGYDLIKAHYLPQILADIALQHHGTLPIKYFYAKALKMTDGEVNIEDFSYPGPKPQTKLAAIIMICDASEACTRALPDRKIENVERAVREVIEERVELDQFTECEITLKDLNIIKDTIVRCSTGINHSRVNYPKIRFAVEEDDSNEDEVKVDETK